MFNSIVQAVVWNIPHEQSIIDVKVDLMLIIVPTSQQQINDSMMCCLFYVCALFIIASSTKKYKKKILSHIAHTHTHTARMQWNVVLTFVLRKENIRKIFQIWTDELVACWLETWHSCRNLFDEFYVINESQFICDTIVVVCTMALFFSSHTTFLLIFGWVTQFFQKFLY